MSDVISTTGSDSGGIFSLTQIRHLMRVEFGRAQRYRYPITCMIVEIDRLGYLRDLYGYDLKEAVIDDVVALVQRGTRSCDYLGRQVDDRLMVVMPHTDREGGRSAAGRLLEGVRELQFEVDGRTLHITVSIGAAHFEEDNTLFFDQLVEGAEAAVTGSSEAGGNRFTVHEVGKVGL